MAAPASGTIANSRSTVATTREWWRIVQNVAAKAFCGIELSRRYQMMVEYETITDAGFCPDGAYSDRSQPRR